MTPIVYSAVAKAEGVRKVPAEVIALCTEVTCGRCGTTCLALTASWKHTAALAQRSGRAVAVLCYDCFDRDDDVRDTILLYHFDPVADAALARRQLESN